MDVNHSNQKDLLTNLQALEAVIRLLCLHVETK